MLNKCINVVNVTIIFAIIGFGSAQADFANWEINLNVGVDSSQTN